MNEIRKGSKVINKVNGKKGKVINVIGNSTYGITSIIVELEDGQKINISSNHFTVVFKLGEWK